MRDVSQDVEPDVTWPEATRELFSSIRATLLVHQDMFVKMTQNSDNPSADLVELLEDVGNIYLTYSENLAKSLKAAKLKH